LDPDNAFPDNNESNNVWTAGKSKLEKDIILDAYLGNYVTSKSPLTIEMTEKNSVLSAELPNYPKFSLSPVTGEKDTFESQRAGLKFKFNEAKTGFDMIILGNNQVIPFTKK
jgi:hypothetical protein